MSQKAKLNFTLLHDLVMIFPVAKAKTTDAGIIIKETIDATAPIEGFVISTGPGKADKQGNIACLPVVAGDRVIFVRNAAKEVKYAGDTFFVVPISEVLCKINNEAA